MVTLELTPRDSEVTVEVTTERIAEALGNQGILSEEVENTGHIYLAALALECRDSGKSIEETLDEFVSNSYGLDNDYTA